jgi:hypothetical protein
MQELGSDARRRKHVRASLGPLDEDDRVLEIGLQVAPLRRGEADEAVEVEVRDAVVTVADGERRAGDRLCDAERAARSPDERRLARAELARDRDDVSDAQRRGEPGRDRLRFLRCRRLDLDEGETRVRR